MDRYEVLQKKNDDLEKEVMNLIEAFVINPDDRHRLKSKVIEYSNVAFALGKEE